MTLRKEDSGGVGGQGVEDRGNECLVHVRNRSAKPEGVKYVHTRSD